MTHDELVRALREIDGLTDVGGEGHPNFQFRSQPFLHFHGGPDGAYADVRFGRADFEPVPASTATERQALLARVQEHVERVGRARKDRRRDRRSR